MESYRRLPKRTEENGIFWQNCKARNLLTRLPYCSHLEQHSKLLENETIKQAWEDYLDGKAKRALAPKPLGLDQKVAQLHGILFDFVTHSVNSSMGSDLIFIRIIILQILFPCTGVREEAQETS